MEKKNSRLLVFAIPFGIVLLGLVIYQYGFEEVRKERASIKEMQMAKWKTLTKSIAVINEKPSLETKLTELKEERKNDTSKLFEAQTTSLAANALSDTVKGIVTGRGGSISSERVEKPDDLGSFKIINVTMDIVLPDVRALNDVIYGIETRTPYIVVKELDTRVRNFREPRELMAKLRIAALTVGK